MSKTKIIIIVAAVIVAAALAVVGIKFANKPAGNEAEQATTAQTSTTKTANSMPIEIGDYTTLKPFVDSQTEVLTPTTTMPSVTVTTEAYEEHATQIDSANGWKDDALTDGLPKLRVAGISTLNYVTDKGNRTVIRIDNLDYDSYLAYIDKLESAGFADNNNRAHIPATAPSKVAMFYSKYDGKRSFGVYWYGDASQAGFDCEIVIADYDQAL